MTFGKLSPSWERYYPTWGKLYHYPPQENITFGKAKSLVKRNIIPPRGASKYLSIGNMPKYVKIIPWKGYYFSGSRIWENYTPYRRISGRIIDTILPSFGSIILEDLYTSSGRIIILPIGRYLHVLTFLSVACKNTFMGSLDTLIQS